MISNKLARTFLEQLDYEIDSMKIVFEDESYLLESVTFTGITDLQDQKVVKRDAKATFDVSELNGLTIKKVVLMGGGDDLYYDITDYLISGIETLDVVLEVKIGYDYIVE